MPLNTDNNQMLTDLVFKEPLTEVTLKMRKNLIFTSAIAILLTVYDLKIKKTPWLDIEVPVNAPNILHGAISVALIYLFLVFLFYAWEDFRRWSLARELLHTHSYFDLTLSGRNHLNTIEHLVENVVPLPESQSDQYRRITANLNKAEQFFNEVDSKVEEVYKNRRSLGIIQWFRLIVLDLGIPIIVATIALIKIFPAVFPFVAAVFK